MSLYRNTCTLLTAIVVPLAVAATSCTDVDLCVSPCMPQEQVVIDNAVTIEGEACTVDPAAVLYPYKVLFVIDVSGSNRDSDPFNANVCRDADADTCDDCTSGTDDPANDGTDTDSDGACDAGDADDDNDGVDDPLDQAPLHTHGPEGGHSHSEMAFTTWLDPTLALEHARVIAEALADLRPDREEVFEQNLHALEGDLARLDQRLERVAQRLGESPLVFSHVVLATAPQNSQNRSP